MGRIDPLVTDKPVKVQDVRKILDHFRANYRICLKLINKNQNFKTCNRLDLESLGPWPRMIKIFPGHCDKSSVYL